MSKFKLSDYAVDKKNDAGDNDREHVPFWVESGTKTTKNLYKCILNEYEMLVQRIETSKTILSINDRRIVNKRIANKCCVDKSNITIRRQPDIVDLINNLNNRLATLWERIQRRKKTSGKKLTKRELEIDRSDLVKEINRLKVMNLTEYVNRYIESKVLSKQRELSKENSILKKDLAKEEKRSALLEDNLRKSEDEIRRMKFSNIK